MAETIRLTGGCQCGAVRYALSSKPAAPGICHCRMCQKAGGGPFMAFARVPESDVTWTRGTLSTFQSSSAATRGFCSACGSVLFWDPIGRDITSVAMGAFEKPTDTRLAIHIFVADKGDYYDIADGLPQNQQ